MAGKLPGSGAFQLFPHHKGRIVIFGRYSSRRATALIKFSPIRHRRAASFALLLTLPLLVGATSLTASFDQPILEAHNRERAALGVPRLRWNADLARAAGQRASDVARNGRFGHILGHLHGGPGENLWAGTRGVYAPQAMVQRWSDEKRNFRPGIFPDNSRTGKVADVGHYTQMVWRATRDVGCARAASDTEDILVCFYTEPGNFLGERPF